MEETAMNDNRRYGWAIALLVVLLTVAAAGVAYNIGLSHGVAEASASAATATPPPYPYEYGWHRPWGFGFLFFPLFFFGWVLLARALFWRPWRPWYYGGPPSSDQLEDWHRRAHDRMNAKE
jgi:hypothetical protein